jgi:hypothetical protein
MLTVRPEAYTYVLLSFVSVSIIIVALARSRNIIALRTVLVAVVRLHSLDQYMKENMRLESFSSIMLLFNYFISAALCLFLCSTRVLNMGVAVAFLLSVLLPILFFIIATCGVLFIGWLSGEQQLFSLSRDHTITTFQLSGLACTLLSFIWALNPGLDVWLTWSLLIVILFSFLLRVFKEAIVVLRSGVLWYYLILYFCTLEVLPLLAAYQYFSENYVR